MTKKLLKKLLVYAVIIGVLLLTPVFIPKINAEDNSARNIEYLKSVMDMIKEKYNGEVTDSQLIEGALKGMFSTMDPYTAYYTNEEANNFMNSINGTFEGIGAVLEKDGDYVIITKVYPQSPAEKSGLIPGDKIVTVDGQNIIGSSPEEAAALIRGQAGTKVVLGIMKNGVTAVTNIEIVRDIIRISPVTYEIKNNIGYIKLDTFNSNTDEFMTQALTEMDKKGITRIILDLRDNPGGQVDQAVAVAKNFVPKGLITKLDFKSESQADQEYYSDLETVKYRLAVLVNGSTASASEIVSGAVQDMKSGTLIGTKTFGKAKVQNLIPLLTPEAREKYKNQLGVSLVDGYDLLYEYGITLPDDEIQGWTKITTGIYTTPLGRMIDEAGITPDITVADPVPVAGISINSVQKLAKTSKPALNAESTDVYNAEKILKISGYDVDAPDMKLDQKTFKAIAQFQKDSKLYPYGVLDFTTQQALNAKLDELKLKIDKQYAKAIELLSK